MKVDGHCFCGKIKFEAEADPATVIVCHCTDCQELTGTAYRAVVTASNLKILSGSPKGWVKTADSGRTRKHYFCPDCGSPICSGPTEGGFATVSLRIGTLTQRRDLKPGKQIWTRSALPWVQDLHDLEGHEKQ